MYVPAFTILVLGFRPLAGDLSSLLRQLMIQIFHLVSVPLQGTYLPYELEPGLMIGFIGFRPLAGDLSSLRQ